MKTSFRTLFLFLGRCTLACTLLAGILQTGRSADAPPKSRDQEIADVKKQIEALQKRLTELEKPATPASPSAPEGSIPTGWVKSMTWRNIGPATMGGRITAISVYEADPTTYWIATASGGLLKTTNNGVTFEHQFDRETTVSIGDVCVAPSNRDIVWVGTGENNPRNSVSYGDGAYKSIDGGKTWKPMGLRDSYQIGKILIHPTNPDIVYVGALGRLYGPNAERGVFKTTDGGKTWEKVLFIDERTGVIDMRMHPSDPNTVIAAGWERKRDEFDSFVGEKPPEGIDRYDPVVKYGKNGGLYKTTDGGKKWTKLTKGLPDVATGRIGLDWFRKDPKIVFAIIDSEKIGTGNPPPPAPYMGIQGEDGPGGARLTSIVENGPAAKAGLKVGDIVLTINGKNVETYAKMVDSLANFKVGDKIQVGIQRDAEKKNLDVTLEARPAATQRPARETPSAGFSVREREDSVRVATLVEDSPAAKAGLTVDDKILEIDGKKPVDLQILRDVVRGRKVGDKIELVIERAGAVKKLQIQLEAARAGRGGAASGGPQPDPKRPYGGLLGGQMENRQNQQGPEGFQTGGIYRSADGGETWTRINSLNPRPMYFSQVRVDPADEKLLYVLGISLYASTDGGKTFAADRKINQGVHADQHALWINPRDGRHMLVGTDGGFYVTYDRMQNWEHLGLAALAQFYHVCVDNRKPYRVYGGLQDNGSWGGPSRTLRSSGPVNEDWFMIGGGDGFVCRVDLDDPDIVYSESQDGFVRRRNLRTGESGAIRPRAAGGGGLAGMMRSTSGAPAADQPRFNWNTPFILSHHNSKIVYVGGDKVYRSLKQGADLKAISPEITRGKRGTATALAESPRNADILWVGSDDGAIFVTRDGGKEWKRVDEKLGISGPRWVATIEASRFADGRAYVALDAHRSDDDKPYLFVTEDFGQTWKPITGNLPARGSTRCLREDVVNQNLLLCGTEFGVFASINRGGFWTSINNNLPTVAVHELAIHPTAGEVVAATHGRSLWILDMTALRQMTPDIVKAPAHLFAPAPAVRWRQEPDLGSIYGTGVKKFVGQNPPAGAAIFVALNKKPEKISLKVVDYAGQTVRDLTVKSEPGLQVINWNLTRPSASPLIAAVSGQDDPEATLRRPGGLLGTVVPPGQYRVILTVDGKEFAQPLKIEADPSGTQAISGIDSGEDND